MKCAWYNVESCFYDELDDDIESVPALIRSKEWYIPSDASKIDLESHNELSAKTLDVLRQQQIPDESVISTVASLVPGGMDSKLGVIGLGDLRG